MTGPDASGGGGESSADSADDPPEGPYFTSFTPRSRGDGTSPSAPVSVTGDRIQVELVRWPAGAGVEQYTRENEQFIYVVEGTVRSQIDGHEETMAEESVIYVPSDAEHTVEVVGRNDAYVYTVSPVTDGDVTQEDIDDLNRELESTVLRAGEETCHYDLSAYEQRDSGSAYATTEGFVIEGELIQIGKMRMERGTGADPHTHPNEQINYTLEGEGRWQIDESEETVIGPGGVIHIPSEAVHQGYATDDGDLHFLAAKDKSYRMYGDPVDS